MFRVLNCCVVGVGWLCSWCSSYLLSLSLCRVYSVSIKIKCQSLNFSSAESPNLPLCRRSLILITLVQLWPHIILSVDQIALTLKCFTAKP